MLKAKDVQEILKNNPQIKTATFNTYPLEKDLFWRGFKSTLGGCFAFGLVLFVASIIMFLVRIYD